MSNRVDAVCVVVERSGSILAIAKSDGWGLPGGKCEEGENPTTAASRELHEETGLLVAPENLVALFKGVECGSGKTVQTYLVPDPGGKVRSSPEGPAGWVNWGSLIEGDYGTYNARVRDAYVASEPRGWAMERGSGSLRRAIEEAMNWREMYLSERVAWEYGYGFELVPASRVLTGAPLAEGDSPPTTEACWFARVLRWRLLERKHWCEVQVRWIRIDDLEGAAREGMGLVIEPGVKPSWIPAGRVIVALLAGGNPC